MRPFDGLGTYETSIDWVGELNASPKRCPDQRYIYIQTMMPSGVTFEQAQADGLVSNLIDLLSTNQARSVWRLAGSGPNSPEPQACPC